MENRTENEVWREVPHGQLYLERAEAAIFGRLVQEVNDGQLDRAEQCIGLLEHLSLV